MKQAWHPMAYAWTVLDDEGREITSVAAAVLLAVAGHADNKGACWPGQRTLARRTRLSTKSVQRGVQELAGLGVLEYREWVDTDHGGRQTSHLYVLDPSTNSAGIERRGQPAQTPGPTVQGGVDSQSRGRVSHSPGSPGPTVHPRTIHKEVPERRSSLRSPRVRPARRDFEAEEATTLGDTTRLFRPTAAEEERTELLRPMSNPQRSVSLAKKFKRLGSETGIPGHTRLRAPGKADEVKVNNGLVNFLRQCLNDDTPWEILDSMIDHFFVGTKQPSDQPLWRQFIQDAARLHNVAVQRTAETTRASRRAAATGPQISGNVPAYLRAALAAQGIEVG